MAYKCDGTIRTCVLLCNFLRKLLHIRSLLRCVKDERETKIESRNEGFLMRKNARERSGSK